MQGIGEGESVVQRLSKGKGKEKQMSLYNMLHGVNQATFFILPMLGEKHPDKYPRFRDCWFDKDENRICVYTRVGGNNRGCGFGEDDLYKHPLFISTEDDDFDNTYATYYFSVPDEFKDDLDKILAGKIRNTSEKYKSRIFKVFPTIKEKLEKILNEPQTQKETHKAK